MSINLAPNHKQGLILENPVMLAGGSIGYGEAIHRGVQPQKLGAVVVGPILRHSRAGTSAARVAETNGGMVLHTDLQNRGVTSVLKKFAKGWAKVGCPVIAQVADDDPDLLIEVVERLTDAAMGIGSVDVELAAMEWSVARATTEESLRNTLRVVIKKVDLPLFVKLPLERAAALAQIAAEMGVSSVVIGQPIIGAGLATKRARNVGASENDLVVGELFGPLAFASMMAALHQVVALGLPCTTVASGGIHTLEQARQALVAGADALQIDSALWVEPGLPAFIVEHLELSLPK